MHDRAADVQAFLSKNPAATVGEVAEHFEMEFSEAQQILEDHVVSDDGTLRYRQGGGGNWAPPPEPEPAV